MQLEGLTEWFKAHDISHESIIISAQDSYRILACTDLKAGQVVAKIAKTSILSPKTCGIADILTEYQVTGVLALTIALMYERFSPNSPWSGYLDSLPVKEPHLPLFWTEAEKELLVGTDLEQVVKTDCAFLKQDFEILSDMVREHPMVFEKSQFTFDAFLNATSIVTSRSFCVDSYHGDSLVPLSDLFNHSSSHSVCVQGNNDVCPDCGSEFDCLCFMADQHDHDGDCHSCGGSEHSWQDEDDEENDEDEEEEAEGEGEDEIPELEDLEDSENGILEMTLVQDVAAGQEIFNTYGSHSNTFLLHRYGFMETDNPHDSVQVTLDQVLAVISAQVSSSTLQKRLKLWKGINKRIVELEMGDDLEDEEGDELDLPEDAFEQSKFCIMANGRPNLALLAYLYTIFAKEQSMKKCVADRAYAQKYLTGLEQGDWTVKTVDGQESTAVNSTKKSSVSEIAGLIVRCIVLNRLKAYPGSIQEGESLLASIDEKDFNKRAALTLRINEQRILSSALDQ